MTKWLNPGGSKFNNPYEEKVKLAKENLDTEFNPTPEYANALLNPIQQPQQPSLLDKVKALNIQGLFGSNAPVQSPSLPPLNSSAKFFPAHTVNPTIAPFAAHTPTIAPRLNPLDGIGNALSDFGKGIWQGGIRSAAEPYRQEDIVMFKTLLNDPKLSAKDREKYQAKLDALEQRTPYQPTSISGKAGSFAGSIVGNAPAFALGGAATEGIAQNVLGKLAPKVAPKLLPYVERSVKDSLSFAPIGLMDSNNLQDVPKNVAENALTGAVLGPALHGVGEGLKLGKDIARNSGSLKEALAERQLSYPELKPNPLQDVQNVFRNPIVLRDAQAEALNKTFTDAPNIMKPVQFKPLQQAINEAIGVRSPLPEELLQQKKLDAQSVFGGPRELKQYKLATSEQKAFDDLQEGIRIAQEFQGSNKLINDFAGEDFTNAAAMDNIKHYTGVDLPKLLSNWEKTQKVRGPLTQAERLMGRKAGVIPPLRQREGFPIQEPTIKPPLLQRALPEKQPLIWTNKDNIPTAGPLPIRSITPENLGLLPKLQTRSITQGNLGPKLPTAKVNLPLGPGIPSRDLPPLLQSQLSELPINPRRIESPLNSNPVTENIKMTEASSHPVAEHIMGKLDDFEAAARARIAANKGRLNSGLPVDTMVDYSIIGAVKIARGAVKYSVWASDMVSDLGSSVKPYLKDIWEESNRQHSLMVDGTFSTALPEPQSKIIIGKTKEPFSFSNAWDKFYTGVVNTQQPIVNAAKIAESDMGKLASNTKNVSGIVDYNFLKGMVDKNGNQVGSSLKSAVEAIPKGQEEKFWTYMSQRHNIDRAREGKPVQSNYTHNMSAEAVKITEREHPEYRAIGDGITKWIDDFMQTWGVGTGIVNKELYEGLRKTYKSYFPTQRDFSTLEKAIPDNVSQKFADQRTPIRKATGSERDIIDPIENIMQLVNRTIRTAKYNEVGQSLLNSVRQAPEKLKPLAEVIKTKDGMFSNKDNVITVLENGKPVYLQINDKMLLDSMNGLPKTIGNIPVLSTLTNGFKGLITQKNPLFAIRNIFRDIPTAYVYGSESNPFKFGAGLLGAGKDILTNGPRLQKYQAVGGGGANFFNPGDVTKSAAELMGKGSKIKKVLAAPIHAIEKFNNLTETAPRLAEFNRVFDKTGDVTKALYAANDVSVNFSRGGNITKNVDKVVPYLNAGVQGLDKFFRGFKDPKTAVSTIVRSGVAITTPTLALYLVNKDNPNYQALDNRTKDTYYLIPKEDGTFIKLPKSRELGVLFSSLLERGLRKATGQENSFKGFGNTVATNFSPANPIDSNFFAPATWNIATNKDFANRAIIPQAMLMDKRSKYLQYDEKTTSIAKAIGKLSAEVIPGGISPKQLDYLVKSYSGVIGQFGIPLATPGGTPGKTLTSQFVADPTFSNQATTDFYDKLDKLSAAAVDKNILQKIPSKKLTPEEDMRNSMNGISSALSQGTKLINNLQVSSDPLKDDKVRAIKLQMLDLTRKASLANNPRSMQAIENSSKNMFKK